VTVDNQSSLSTQNGHGFCLLCGERNPWSLKIAFEADGNGNVSAKLQSHSGLQGYDGLIHGGVISALLDAAMTHCLFHRGVQAVTGDLRVRFRRLIPCHTALFLQAWVISARPPLYCLRAEVMDAGRLAAWAEAKFMQQTTL
jgi:acyl-coenzyme A thioesterase PaaI-like protein